MDNLALSLGLIGIGMLLLVAELFIPSGGLITVLALLAIVSGVAIPFLQGDTQTGLLTALGVIIVLPVLAVFLMNYWPRSRMGRRLTLEGPDEESSVPIPAGAAALEKLRGRIGRAVSMLRPAGVVDFDGQRIDCLSEGPLVEPGTWVRCLDVKPGRVIVRPIDEPDLEKLEKADFR